MGHDTFLSVTNIYTGHLEFSGVLPTSGKNFKILKLFVGFYTKILLGSIMVTFSTITFSIKVVYFSMNSFILIMRLYKADQFLSAN